MSADSCENCFYVQTRNITAPHGGMVTAFYCRRYPPTSVGIMRVEPNGWCGEYHKAKGKKK